MAICTVADIFDKVNNTSGNILTITSLISKVQVVRALIQCLEDLGPIQNLYKHLIICC